MTISEKLLRRVKVTYFIIAIAILTVGLFSYKFYHAITTEEVCHQQALQEVGGEKGWSSKMLTASGWVKEETGLDSITLGYYKQLECESHKKAFMVF